MFAVRVGDLEKDEEFLESRSPLFKADKIKIPLLIGQGANDPRVKQAESEQIVEAMKKAKQAGRVRASSTTRATASPGRRTA